MLTTKHPTAAQIDAAYDRAVSHMCMSAADARTLLAGDPDMCVDALERCTDRTTTVARGISDEVCALGAVALMALASRRAPLGTGVQARVLTAPRTAARRAA